MQLKAKVKNYANEHNLKAQSVLQTYMLDHFLMRIAESKYKGTVIIKGGMLIAALLGAGNRSTMDLDTTLKHFTLNESELKRMVDEIVSIHLDDDIRYEFVSLSPIRKDDDYGGLRAD